MKLLFFLVSILLVVLLPPPSFTHASPADAVDEETNGDETESIPTSAEEEAEAEGMTQGKNQTEYEFHNDMLKDCAPSDVAVTQDEWTKYGPPPNCTFPFIYQGRIYFECINLHWGGNYWCANSCDFKSSPNKRGKCAIVQNNLGFMGTGFALSFLNVFIALMMTTAFAIGFVLCIVEMRARRNRRVEDSSSAFHIPGVSSNSTFSRGAQSGRVATI